MLSRPGAASPTVSSYQMRRRHGRARGLAWVAAMGLCALASPAAAHWCDCLWDSRYNIVIRPVLDSIDVPEVGSATLEVWLQNNMGYPLSNYALYAFANDFNIVRSVDSSSRTGSFVLPGERVRETLTITRDGVDETIAIDDISFYVRFGGGVQDSGYGSSNVTSPPSTVNPSSDTAARRQAGSVFHGVTPIFESDSNTSQARHLRSAVRADFGDAGERANGITYLFNEYCVGRDSWASGDGRPVNAAVACPPVDGPPDTACASESARTGQTMTKYDWQHVWSAGELVYRWSILSDVQRAALRDRLYCGSRDEVVAVRVFNLFLLGFLGKQTGGDGPFTADVSGAAGASSRAFLTGLAGGSGAVANAAKAALLMMGETTRQTAVEGCLTSGDAFAEIVCAAALNIQGLDANDAYIIAEVSNRVSWTYNEGDAASEWVGLYAAHVLNLAAWHYRTWQPAAADAGVVSFYREEEVAPRAPANLGCALTGAPPQLTLTWNAVTQDTGGGAEPFYVGYRIYWGEAAGNYVHAGYTTATSFMPPNLAPGGTYFFTVRAVDDSLNASSAAPEVSCVVGPDADPPTAVITCAPTSGTAPLSVTCDCDQSSDPNDNINHCYFRVGSSGTWQEGLGSGVTFDFSTAGSRTVNLRVTDDTGLEDTDQVTITVNDPNNDAPAAVVTADVTSGTPPLTVQLDGSGSSDPDGAIVAYAWDFDDSQTSTEPSPTHVFATEGVYDVTLTVTDDGTPALTGEGTVRITVSASGTVNQPPACANPTVSPESGDLPLRATFDARSCMDPDGDTLTIAWTVASVWNPQVELSGALVEHTFTAEDEYTVTLTVTDDGVPPRQIDRVFDVHVGEADPFDPDGLAPLVAAGCGCTAGGSGWGALVLVWVLRRGRRAGRG